MMAILTHHQDQMNLLVITMNTVAICVIVSGILFKGASVWGLVLFLVIHVPLYIWRKSLDFPT